MVIGLLSGLGAAGQWETFLLFRNSQPFGKTDPQFGMDVGFYVFTLPWLTFVVAFLSMALIIGVIVAAFTHYIFGGLQFQARARRTTSAARLHLSILLAAIVLVRAASYWLERYSLTTKSTDLMTGIQYTDANAVLPTKAILAIASIMCALMFLSVIWTKSWRLPIVGVVLLLVVSVVVGGIFPALIQSLRVKPSEKSFEAPYIQNNINATRDAFGLSNVDTKLYNAATTATQGQLRNDTTTVPGIRILDPNVVSATYQQLQAGKSYYQFPDILDVDRYTVDGLTRDTVVAVRELDLDGVPAGQRNWLNDHTVYTHGYGIVAAYGNRKDADGKPVFFEQGIPSTGSLGEFQPRIYFGEQSPDYSIVGAAAGASPREFDFPDSSPAGQANTTYEADGGVPIGNLPVKVAYAIKYREMNFLLSDAVNADSRLLDHRTPRDRVQRVAPWLTLDGNAYPAVVDNKVQWIVDGYTTTADYPNSHLTSIEQATSDSITTTRTSVQAVAAGQVNYIRNSVKATVDAYDGTVHLYAWDDSDPMLKAWMGAFPGTVQPMSDISAGLMSHLRYPEDLFKVQREILARYHVTDPGTFYGSNDLWKVPADPTKDQRIQVDQPPYYLSIAMPGQDEPQFSLTTTFMPFGTREVLSGFLAVDSNAGTTARAATGGVRPAAAARAAQGQQRQRSGPGAERHLVVERPTARGWPRPVPVPQHPETAGIQRRAGQPADPAGRRRSALRGADLRPGQHAVGLSAEPRHHHGVRRQAGVVLDPGRCARRPVRRQLRGQVRRQHADDRRYRHHADTTDDGHRPDGGQPGPDQGPGRRPAGGQRRGRGAQGRRLHQVRRGADPAQGGHRGGGGRGPDGERDPDARRDPDQHRDGDPERDTHRLTPSTADRARPVGRALSARDTPGSQPGGLGVSRRRSRPPVADRCATRLPCAAWPPRRRGCSA